LRFSGKALAAAVIISLAIGAVLGASTRTRGTPTTTVTLLPTVTILLPEPTATQTIEGPTVYLTVSETRTVELTRTADRTILSTITLPPRTTTILHTTTSLATVTATVSGAEAVCFSRVERCDGLLIRLIDGARSRVYVAIYILTRDSLAQALIRARERGVEVRVVMEEREAYGQGSDYLALKGAGVDVRLDGNPALMHHKFMVIDGEVVVTGSYNWSSAAEERNDENIIVIRDPRVAGEYEREFARIWEQASRG